MKHFLITRFNLVNKVWENTQNITPKVLSEDWLDYRFFLFENYCLPSVKNQVNKNFTWFILFDNGTPQKYRNQIDELISNETNIKLLFIDGFEELTNSLKFEIKNLLSNNDKYIITTRLDNDDIIHKDFIKTIQKLYEPRANVIIDLKKGYQLILEHPTELREYQYAFNPYISLIEPSDKFNTILSREHLKWRFYTKKHNLYLNDRLWIQLIHKQNLMNIKASHLRRVNNFKPEKFDLKINLHKYNGVENLLFNFRLLPRRIFENLKLYIKIRSSNKE